ncbi:DNA translocase FtsK [Pantoea brenneri]|uniref:DNA translocase FtsK n=1 Tax=Pantoea brenneri TaxID=472694 RepID=UPI0028965FAC|nr:DNA translocase FtsK [Pantoea brenneri]
MDDDWDEDPLLIEAAKFAIENNNCSISRVQRHLRIGYNRASRLVELLELLGLVSEIGINGNRQVLHSDFDKWWESVEALSKEELPAPDMTNVVIWPGQKKDN